MMPQIEIEPDEALVLFELLSRYSDGDMKEVRVAFPGERTALMSLLCYLEKQLVEPFKPDYLQLVSQARARLVERSGETT